MKRKRVSSGLKKLRTAPGKIKEKTISATGQA